MGGDRSPFFLVRLARGLFWLLVSGGAQPPFPERSPSYLGSMEGGIHPTPFSGPTGPPTPTDTCQFVVASRPVSLYGLPMAASSFVLFCNSQMACTTSVRRIGGCRCCSLLPPAACHKFALCRKGRHGRCERRQYVECAPVITECAIGRACRGRCHAVGVLTFFVSQPSTAPEGATVAVLSAHGVSL